MWNGFFKDLPVIADSKEVLFELSKKYELFIASAAMEFKYSLLHKHEWMTTHFPFIPWVAHCVLRRQEYYPCRLSHR